MKEFLTKTLSSKPITVCVVLFILIAATRLANADPLKEARVSQVIQDVRVLEAHAAPHPAAVNDKVTLGSAVRTGVESRAELTFNDLTITRLGANTIFSFTAGARQAELTQGTILLQVKPGAPAVRANTTAVTVAVMGGTALLSTGPPTKFMVLEGIGTIYPLGHPEKAVTVHGGEMVIAEGGHISKPEKFDVKLVLETSPLFLDFPPLANLPLILAVVDQQQAELFVVTSNPPPYRSFLDVIDVTDLNANANPAVIEVRSETPPPTPPPPTPTPPPPTPTPPPPTPSKFGTPTVITSPNPNLITSGTTITTDPSITTNGVTDLGKIYRGATLDGAFTLWAFGSTSAFDTALNLDTEFFADPSHLPIAAFKFQSLLLNGNPTIDLSNGGVTKLALIGVDGITSGPPGGTLTFTGLDLLVLATVNGSINLTSDVSFQNLNELAMYARGAGSNLILNSPISDIGILKLAAEGSIQLTNPGTMSVGDFETTAGDDQTLQIGGSLLTDGRVRLKTLVLPGTTLANGANVTLNIAGDYTNSSATEDSLLHVRNEGAHIGTGGNIDVNIGGNLTAMNDFTLVVQNANGQIDNGGNVDLTVGGTTSTTNLSEGIDNTNGGVIDNGGNVTLHTVGPVMLDGGFSLEVDNFNGGTINNGANVTAHFVGDVTATAGSGHSFNWYVINGSGFFTPTATGGTIVTGGDINITFDGDASTTGTSDTGSISAQIFNGNGGSIGNGGNISMTVGGNLNSGPLFIITDNEGGHIGTGGNNTLQVAGNITAQGNAVFEIDNNDKGDGSGPGTMGSNATINVHAANISTGTSLFADIQNFDGGTISGNAAINFNIDNAVSSGSTAFFGIDNDSQTAGSPGGSIGGNATVDVSIGGALSAGGNLFARIRNEGGFIGGDATVDVSIGGAFSAGGDLFARIRNEGGGFIGGDATMNFSAASISIGGSDAYPFLILNGDGGHIGGNAELDVTTGSLMGNSISANIANDNGGIIGSDAMIGVAANNISVGDSLNAFLTNQQGSIGGNAAINFLAPAGIHAGNGAFFAIVNEDNNGATVGGTIHGDALVHVTADHLSTQALVSSDFNLFGTIHNSGGSIMGNCDVMFDISGAITTEGRANFDILNFGDGGPNGGGTIGGDATVNVSANSLTTTTTQGDAGFEIFNGSLGSIGGSAIIGLSLTGDLTAQGVANFIIGNSNGSSGGTIGGSAVINVSAANVTANSLLAQIDNSTGATIGGNATINMNVPGTATVTNDATIAIYGSDGAVGGAAININGGNYNVGGTFLSYIDGNGTMTFNNATAHADVLKAGVFGANGVLNVGGGILSADTTLKLYASGSNGQLNFVSNVTLGGNSVKILAANSVTIFNNIVVTIGGPNPAEVYTNNANYTGFGGNGTTTGTFAGAGANNPLPLDQAPPFGAPPSGHTPPVINVSNTDELLALLDGAVVGPDGRITISGATTRSNLRDLSRINMNGLPRGVRRMLINEMRDRSTTRMGNRRIL
jgi:hypothetical protein